MTRDDGKTKKIIIGVLCGVLIVVAGIAIIKSSVTYYQNERARLQQAIDDSDLGKIIDKIEKDMERSEQLLDDIHESLEESQQKIDDIDETHDYLNELIDRIFELSDMPDKTAEEQAKLEELVEEFNSIVGEDSITLTDGGLSVK